MLLEALIERSKQTAIPAGYEKASIAHVIRIDASGKYVGIDCLEPPASVLRPKRNRTANVAANTGIDTFLYTLGTGGAGRPAAWVSERHAAYRSGLASINHPAARAIEAFLDDPSSPIFVPIDAKMTRVQFWQVLAVQPVEDGTVPKLFEKRQFTTDPHILGIYNCAVRNARANRPHVTSIAPVIHVQASDSDIVLFHVEGHPQWWLSPEVQAAHARQLCVANKATAGGQIICSICGEQGEPARLFPKSSALGAALISFNTGTPWNGYGFSQGYNAPTCTDCAEGIVKGLDDVAGSSGTHRRWSKDGHLLWWPVKLGDPDLWPLLDAAIDPTSTDEARDAAIEQITDGHFADIEKVSEGRLALRRYAFADAADVRESLRLWNQTCTRALGGPPSDDDDEVPAKKAAPNPVWTMALAMVGKFRRDCPERDAMVDALYLRLVTGESLTDRDIGRVRRTIVLSAGRRAKLEALLAFNDDRGVPLKTEPLKTDIPPEETPRLTSDALLCELTMTASQCAALCVGRIFARLEYLQQARGRTQRPIGVTHMNTVIRDPRKALTQLVDKYGHNRDAKADSLVSGLYTRASKLGIPQTLTSGEMRNAFRLGYYEQQSLGKAYAIAKKAERAAKNLNPQESNSHD